MKRLSRLAFRWAAFACMAALLMAASGCAAKSYDPPEKDPALSPPTIGKNATLRVGVNTDSQPLAGQSQSSSKIVGIDVDVAAALADNLGLKLEIVDVGTDPEAALNEQRVDVVMGIDQSSADSSFWKSDAYLPTAVALFAAPSTTAIPTNDSKTTVAAQVSSKSAWAVTNEFDKGSISTTNDLPSAFAQLSSGQVNYVAADAVIGTYAAHGNDDVHIVALMQQLSGYSIGVSDSNADLKQAVSQALATLSDDGTISVIETKWLGSPLDLSKTPLTPGAGKTNGGTTAGSKVQAVVPSDNAPQPDANPPA